MKKIVFLLCFLTIMSSCEQGQKKVTTQDMEEIAEQMIINKHNEALGSSCNCPSCLGLIDEKDYFLN